VLPGAVRILLIVAGLVYLGFGLRRRLLYPLGIRFEDRDIALWVERNHPELHQELISAVQLGSGPLPKDASPQLAQHLIDQVADKLGKLRFDNMLRPERTPARRRQRRCPGAARAGHGGALAGELRHLVAASDRHVDRLPTCDVPEHPGVHGAGQRRDPRRRARRAAADRRRARQRPAHQRRCRRQRAGLRRARSALGERRRTRALHDQARRATLPLRHPPRPRAYDPLCPRRR
jgi:hypothetical protein